MSKSFENPLASTEMGGIWFYNFNPGEFKKNKSFRSFCEFSQDVKHGVEYVRDYMEGYTSAPVESLRLYNRGVLISVLEFKKNDPRRIMYVNYKNGFQLHGVFYNSMDPTFTIFGHYRDDLKDGKWLFDDKKTGECTLNTYVAGACAMREGPERVALYNKDAFHTLDDFAAFKKYKIAMGL